MLCESCNSPGASLRECRTRYVDETQNICPVLCDVCATDYNAYWDEKWEEYYGGLL